PAPTRRPSSRVRATSRSCGAPIFWSASASATTIGSTSSSPSAATSGSFAAARDTWMRPPAFRCSRLAAKASSTRAVPGTASPIPYFNSAPYFPRRVRLDIVDYIEPKPGVAPSPAHPAQLIAAGRKQGVRAILHEPYEPEDASRFLAQKLGVPVVVLATSVGSVPGVSDYLGLLEYDVAVLARALGAPSQ